MVKSSEKANQVAALRVKRAEGKPAKPRHDVPMAPGVKTRLKAATNRNAKKAKAKKPAKKPASAPVVASGSPRAGTKLEAITALLTRPAGCTTAEVLGVTQWAAVSMPQMAKAAGLTLRKEKTKGEPTRYFGTVS